MPAGSIKKPVAVRLAQIYAGKVMVPESKGEG